MKKIFGKADEMEKSIQLKSLRWAWAYSSLFLLIWSFYELFSMNEGWNFLLWRVHEGGVPLLIILFLSQNLITVLFQLIYRARMAGGENEEYERPSLKAIIKEGPSPKAVQVVMVIVIIILTIRFFLGW